MTTVLLERFENTTLFATVETVLLERFENCAANIVYSTIPTTVRQVDNYSIMLLYGPIRECLCSNYIFGSFLKEFYGTLCKETTGIAFCWDSHYRNY